VNLLDRYIFRSAFWTCAGAMAVFSLVLIVGNAIRRLLGYVLAGQLPLSMFGRLLVLLAELAAPYALPMGILTGVLLTFGRLSSENEVTAMRAAGIGVPRIARPVLLLAVLAAAAALYVDGESMPRAGAAYDHELSEAVRANPLKLLVPKTFIRDFPGYVIYVGDESGGQLRDFWLWQLDGAHRATRFLRAASGRLDYDEPTNELVLTLDHAVVETRSDRDPEDFTEAPPVASFESSDPIHLPLDRLFPSGGPPDPARLLNKGWLTYGQMMLERARALALPSTPGHAKDRELAILKVTLAIEDKLTTACAVFSFALIGVPLGIAVSRKETSANLGVAVLLALGYYFLTVMVGWLDLHPEYRPDLLLWVPNLLLIGTSVWLFRRVSRR
jgi:lipopolysaccharide export system permease protein